MPITTPEYVVYAYNEDKRELIIISEESDDNLFYVIGGQFGKKLYEILKEKKELDEVLENDFKNQDELKRIFLRFILTLIEKDILSPLSSEYFSCLNAFSEKECHQFGTDNFIGNITVTRIDVEELLAQAFSCPPGHVYVSDPFFPACVPMGSG